MARYILVIIAALSAAHSAHADHIPGHDNSDPTFPVPLPGPEFFNGGAVAVTAIGPIAGTVITNTTFDITYVSDGATPASNLMLEISAQVNGGFAEVSVTGADLGFGSGQGTFVGTFETDVLNGVVWQSLFPHSIVDIHIQATTGGIEGMGYFVDSAIVFDVIPVPAPAGLSLLALCAMGARRGRYRGPR